MWSMIICAGLGFIIGIKFFPSKWKKVNGIIQIAAIMLTLFAMGVSLGASPTFFEDIKTLGLRSVVLTIGAVLGSILLVYLFTQKLFVKKGEDRH
ncbi:LysO family transporter [Candidatus Soleaferrea massiliensis]|uniref:LysO family transporter n=1 Tax=Candidatus Soleaferrea massiliensis TaxID=1470354 RepID=UPI0006932C79|nr:LysO family transporter [Candidatus Soleaferrea massiliensis]